ncbi:MAG: phosphoribosylamine--glycine ligase [Saprospiraceae bacterium]|nr:phosphoribosylamine--glycine ligase [Saprospiraceae bacterium]
MNILIVGSGGREHALAWKIAQSDHCKNLYIAPGNAGTGLCGTNVDIDILDIGNLRQFSLENRVDLLVVGPEAPLVEGITDSFRIGDTKHINIIGPSAYAAQLEGSKAFAKKFMQKYDIPTAAYMEVSRVNLTSGVKFLEELKPPYVLKADGLAAGKGVLIIDDLTEAKAQLKDMLDGKFGKASEIVVIEEFLSGIEFSVFALTDGKSYVLLPEAKDYKRIGEGDTGLNTGGMGAISPVPFIDDLLWKKVVQSIVEPTIKGIAAEKMDYTGFVFFGLISVGGEPMVIEYNCRLGDPETEVIIPRIKSDLLQLFRDAVSGNLKDAKMEVDSRSASTVMMVSGGYPGDFDKGKLINGSEKIKSSLIFHGGTKKTGKEIYTNGGRVLAVTTLNDDYRKAVRISLSNADKIHFEGKYYRHDIGFDL